MQLFFNDKLKFYIFCIIYNSDDNDGKFIELSRKEINNRLFFKKIKLYDLRGVNFFRTITPKYFSYFKYEQIHFLELNLEIIYPHNLYYKFFNQKSIQKLYNVRKINIIANNSLLQGCRCRTNCFYNDAKCFDKINPKKFELQVFIDQAFLKKQRNTYDCTFFPTVLKFFPIKKCIIFNSQVRCSKKINCKVTRKIQIYNKNLVFFDGSFYFYAL